MALNKHKNHYRNQESDDANDDWMNTYGDMITLLMCFFIMLISISKPNQALFEQIKAGIKSQINKNAVIITPLADIKKRLDSILVQERKQNVVSVNLGERGIEMQFSSSALYTAGSADINSGAAKIMAKVSNAIKIIDEFDFKVDVEGHTDDVPIKTARYPSNWELSSARATNIVRFMIASKVDPYRLKAAGFADTRPLAPNIDKNGASNKSNQAKNRRILIRIH
jgi:chemotaxis protein MotB